MKKFFGWVILVFFAGLIFGASAVDLGFWTALITWVGCIIACILVCTALEWVSN